MAEETQRNKPKVIKFKGKSSKFMTGLAIRETRVKASPAIKSVCKPLSKYKPVATLLTTQRLNVSIM